MLSIGRASPDTEIFKYRQSRKVTFFKRRWEEGSKDIGWNLRGNRSGSGCWRSLLFDFRVTSPGTWLWFQGKKCGGLGSGGW